MQEDSLFRSKAPASDAVITLCGDDGVEFLGRRYVPDETKAYLIFKMAHAFPVTTMYGTALHPSVTHKSFKSLEHQFLNFEHQIAAYETDRDVRDRVVGSVLAVDYPSMPAGGWRIGKDPTQSPGITALSVIFKQAQGLSKILGEHVSGKHRYAVSMECAYRLDGSGFAVELRGKQPEFNFTPSDMLAAGYEYVPYLSAPPELQAVFSRKKNRVVAMYKGRKCFVLMGGIDGQVHFAGTGLVRYGAEPPARILRLVASGTNVAQELSQAITTVTQKLSEII